MAYVYRLYPLHILVKELSAYEGGAAYEYHLSAVEGGYLYFTVIHWATIPWSNEFVCDPNNTWYKHSKTLEVKENKVSTISLRNPTDYNYPSEKAVVDFLTIQLEGELNRFYSAGLIDTKFAAVNKRIDMELGNIASAIGEALEGDY